jgi:hypothetical protein
MDHLDEQDTLQKLTQKAPPAPREIATKMAPPPRVTASPPQSSRGRRPRGSALLISQRPSAQRPGATPHPRPTAAPHARALAALHPLRRAAACCASLWIRRLINDPCRLVLRGARRRPQRRP